MERIKRVSLFFRIIFQIIFLALPVLLIIGWVYAPDSHVMLNGFIQMDVVPRSYKDLILHKLAFSEKLFGFSLSLIPLCVQLLVLYFLIKLFRLYEQGEVFSVNIVRYIRNIGYVLLIGEFLNPIYQAAMGVALTLNNPKGQRFAAITLDQTNVGVILIAFMVILISWIMAEGYHLREEHQLTI